MAPSIVIHLQYSVALISSRLRTSTITPIDTLSERKNRSKGRGWEICYVKKMYGMFGVEMRAYGQKLVKFCAHTHTDASPLVPGSIDG